VNAPEPTIFIHDDEVFVRMTRTERWQHFLLAASFVVLAATGLMALFGRGGGAAWRGVLHRSAAFVLIGDLVWHFLYVLLTERGRRNLRDKTPGRQDLREVLAQFRPAPRPEPGRFGVAEKLDYWAFILGSGVMIFTGLLMWAPGLSLRLFPLAVHQAFVVVHGYEAVLAILAILIWHMYAVHLKPGVFPMSRIWLDGRISGADLKRFHPLEYRRIWQERERLAADAGDPKRPA
jgi:cytochrome b subunit of formate dehydrogenase